MSDELCCFHRRRIDAHHAVQVACWDLPSLLSLWSLLRTHASAGCVSVEVAQLSARVSETASGASSSTAMHMLAMCCSKCLCRHASLISVAMMTHHSLVRLPNGPLRCPGTYSSLLPSLPVLPMEMTRSWTRGHLRWAPESSSRRMRAPTHLMRLPIDAHSSHPLRSHLRCPYVVKLPSSTSLQTDQWLVGRRRPTSGSMSNTG